MNENDHAYLHALHLLPGVGSVTLKSLLAHFGTAEAAWQATSEDLSRCEGVNAKALDGFKRRSDISPEKEWEKLVSQGIGVLGCTDKSYPDLLREIPDSPALLYVRGNYDFSRQKILFSVVGSRKFTDYGRQAIDRIVTDLVRSGCVIVSGLAFGIDSLAHDATIAAGGQTLAVLGGGIDDTSIAPASHLKLAQKVIMNGALVSDYPPGTRPLAGTFPARNRIIAGLSCGTLVVEAAPDSGSLITARLALDYNREVFAIPGSIFSPASVGTNRLLRDGAKIVTCLEDILAEFPRLAAPLKEKSHEKVLADLNLTSSEERIMKALAFENLHIDKLIKASSLEAPEVIAALSMLEIRGLVKNIGNMNYIRL